jgi:hypothetical protein
MMAMPRPRDGDVKETTCGRVTMNDHRASASQGSREWPWFV